MQLDRFTDYSLRMLIHVACAPQGRATIAQIAAAYGISEHHLVKVAHFLGKAGLLATTRGRKGGLRLGRAPGEIRLSEVVRLAEETDVLADCFDAARPACAIAPGCRLKRVLQEALDAFHAVLGKYTLADLTENRAALRVLLRLPAATEESASAGP